MFYSTTTHYNNVVDKFTPLRQSFGINALCILALCTGLQVLIDLLGSCFTTISAKTDVSLTHSTSSMLNTYSRADHSDDVTAELRSDDVTSARRELCRRCDWSAATAGAACAASTSL